MTYCGGYFVAMGFANFFFVLFTVALGASFAIIPACTKKSDSDNLTYFYYDLARFVGTISTSGASLLFFDDFDRLELGLR